MGRALLVLVGVLSVPAAVWSQGDPLGPEFRVNSYQQTEGGYLFPAAAADPAGNFVVIWHRTDPQDGSLAGIYGQRFGRIVPVELMRFAAE